MKYFDGSGASGSDDFFRRCEQEAARAEIARLRSENAALITALKDRVSLQAEVDRQRAEIERLRDEDTKTRHALKGWVFVCPDGGDEPTHERVAAVVAEVDRQRAEIEGLRAALREIARLGALVAHDLQGRVEVGKVMAVHRMANEACAALDASRGNTEEDYD